jgi:hypothetical protein
VTSKASDVPTAQLRTNERCSASSQCCIRRTKVMRASRCRRNEVDGKWRTVGKWDDRCRNSSVRSIHLRRLTGHPMQFPNPVARQGSSSMCEVFEWGFESNSDRNTVLARDLALGVARRRWNADELAPSHYSIAGSSRSRRIQPAILRARRRRRTGAPRQPPHQTGNRRRIYPKRAPAVFRQSLNEQFTQSLMLIEFIRRERRLQVKTKRGWN